MPEDSNIALRLLSAGDVNGAVRLARSAAIESPQDWHARYALGQALRFSNDIGCAINELEAADVLLPRQPQILLALAISLQLAGRHQDAVDKLRVALDVDPDFVLAFNSLGMTQKLMGEYEKAAHNYQAGLFVLGRIIVREMRNSRSSRRYPHLTTTRNLWIHYAFSSALGLRERDKFDQIAWPTGEVAERDAATMEFDGWYWQDEMHQDGSVTRLFLPNFFNTFAHNIRRDSTYANLIGNRSTVLELLGRSEEAAAHRQEAEDVIASVYLDRD